MKRQINEADKERIFTETVMAIKEQNANVPSEEIEQAIEEALVWARQKQRNRMVTTPV